MAAPIKVLAENSMKITKIKVKKGQQISKGSLCLFYTSSTKEVKRFKSNDNGVVDGIHVQEGEEVEPGYVLFTVQGCSHPCVMKDMCAECGADLRVESAMAGNRKEEVSASVAMVHSVPELIVSEEEAREIGRADEQRLLKTRKLVLLVDLDQTLIHTTNDNIPSNLKDVHHFQLWHGNSLLWYHTRLRPQTERFLEKISELYELHICTFGVRIYAHTIARILDPAGKYFSHRILSRDECFSPQAKTANLKALFPCGEAMVCIIDDREDVWHFSPNLVHVKPYRFFQGTADINAPPGLTKTEDDSKPMIHRVRRVSQSSTGSKDGSTGEHSGGTTSNGDAESKGDNVNADSDSKEDNNGDKDKKKVAAAETTNETKKDNTQVQSENKENSEEIENKENKINLGDDKKNESDPEACKDNLKQNSDSKEVETKDDSESDIPPSIEKIDNNDKETSQESMEVDKDNGHSAESQPAKAEQSTEAGTTLEGVTKTADNASADSDKTTETKYQTSEPSDATDKAKEGEEEGDMIEWDDEDDYLFYLEEILRLIHKTFYDFYDQIQEKGSDLPKKEADKPNLKDIIPYIKKKALKGCNILFSGVIPMNMNPEKSRAFIVAKALGANIHQEIKHKGNEESPDNFTTHLVAARSGTSKVRSAMKFRKIKIVNPDWLWSCSERWEKVEEVLFPLSMEEGEQGRDSPEPSKVGKKKRKHESDERGDWRDKRARKTEDGDTGDADVEDEDEQGSEAVGEKYRPAKGGEVREENFSMSYNPILAFSDEDLEYMDKEVEDEMEDEDQSSEDEGDRETRMRDQVLKCQGDLDISSSEDSLGGGEMPRGWGMAKSSPKRSRHSSDDEKASCSPERELGPEYDSETDQDKFDKIMDAFGPETENSDEGEYAESIGSVDDEMAEAVMKEFLS